MRDRLLFAALLSSALVTGCSGGGGGTPQSPSYPPTTSPSSAPAAPADQSISDANALGSPIEDFTSYDASIAAVESGASQARARAVANGTCANGVESFAPDRNGDSNSTETLDFYDSACTVLARDLVRIYSPLSASAENVDLTVTLYAPGSSTPIATRTDARTITNATFGSNGYPVASAGFDLVDNDALNLASAKTIASGREFVLRAASGNTQSFCSDSAGYNATGFPKLDETFGWQGGVLPGGTRTDDGSGSVTWTATHAGTTDKGPVGALSVIAGAQNGTCPIATPMFTLAGGTSTGSYSIPLTVTFTHGMLSSLTITGATLANGTTLDIQTNGTASPSSPAYVTGSVSKNGTQIATFGVDAYGDGTLTIAATGTQYVIVDWHVVK